MRAVERFEPALPLRMLVESPRNPRKRFNEHKMDELTASVRDKGVMTPLLVRPVPGTEGFFEIAAGHRRYRAASRAGLAAVPAMVRDLTDAEFLEILTIDNLQREDVHELEEAEGYAELISRTGYTVGLIAAKLSKSLSYIQQRLKLLELRPEMKTEFAGGHFTFSHALMLARLPEDGQARIHSQLYDKDGQVISIADLRRRIEAEIYLDLLNVPWDVHDAQLLPEAGSCTACPNRTGYYPTLFPDLDGKQDYCQDRTCWQRKEQALVQLRVAAVAQQTGRPPVQVSGKCEWNDQRKKKDRLYSGEWKLVQDVAPGAQERCGHTKAAVLVEVDPYGRDGMKLGQRLEVCTNTKCEVHFRRHPVTKLPERKLTVEEQLEELQNDRAREVEIEVRKRMIAEFYESIAWPISLPLAKDLLFASCEHNDAEGAIEFLGMELPADIAADKNYNTRELKALEWLKFEIGPGGANQIAKLLVRELMTGAPPNGELAIAEKQIGEDEAAAVRRMVEVEVGQRYAEREAALLNPPKPAAKKKAGKK